MMCSVKGKWIETVKRDVDGNNKDGDSFVEKKEESIKEDKHGQKQISTRVKCCVLIKGFCFVKSAFFGLCY